MLNVHLRINDAATGKPTPVRLRVSGPDGTAYPPLGRESEFPNGRNEDVGGHLQLGRERWYYIDGACEMPLPAGVALRVQATKGAEYTPLDDTMTLGAGQISLRFAIQRWVESRADGWKSIDTRCHFLAPHAAILEAAAEDLDVANILAEPFRVLAFDGNSYSTTPNLLAFSGQTPALERGSQSVVVNTLNSHPVLGKIALLNSHRPIFPLAFGGDETDDWSICDWCDQCHRKRGLTVWVDAFEPAGGVIGGEALVAAILGKIDAIEVGPVLRKVPLLPWVYRLWNAGFPIPLVGASGKDSNRVALGNVRTYVRVADSGPVSPFPNIGNIEPRSWVEAIRAGQTFVTAGPLLNMHREGERVRVAVRAKETGGNLELIANGEILVATDQTELDAAMPGAGWVAARFASSHGFAHTSPIAIGERSLHPEAPANLRTLVEQTRDWIDTTGRFANPKRKAALFAHCHEALAVLQQREGK